MTGNTERSGAHAEHIAVASEVDLVLFAAANLGDLAHELVLLRPRDRVRRVLLHRRLLLALV